MAFGDVKRIIRGAPYRYTFVFRGSNGNALSSPNSPTTPYFSMDTCGVVAPAAGAPGAPSVQANTGGFMHYLDLTAEQMTADLIEIIFLASSANHHYVALQPEPNLNSGVAANGTTGNITLATTAVATADFYNGAEVEIVRGAGIGQVRTIVTYTTGRVATVDRAWVAPYTTSVYIIHPRSGVPLSTVSSGMRAEVNVKEINGDATAAANMEKLYEGAFISSSIPSGTPTTSSFIGTGLSSTNDFYNDMLVVFTSGTLKGIPRKITDYAGATLTFTTGAFPVAPSVGDTFIVIALVV